MSIWKHYKGGSYELVCKANHEATGEPMAVYKNDKGDTWTRPWAEFEEKFEKVNEGRFIQEGKDFHSSQFDITQLSEATEMSMRMMYQACHKANHDGNVMVYTRKEGWDTMDDEQGELKAAKLRVVRIDPDTDKGRLLHLDLRTLEPVGLDGAKLCKAFMYVENESPAESGPDTPIQGSWS